MSLPRMLREMAESQAGLLKRFKTSYSYVLVPNEKAKARGYAKLWRVLSKASGWTEGRMPEAHPVKTDDRGREMLFSFTKGVRCYDLTKSDRFPVLASDKGAKFLIVKTATCKTCEHYGTTRGPRGGLVPWCALHRSRNKTLITDTLEQAGKEVDRMMGTA